MGGKVYDAVIIGGGAAGLAAAAAYVRKSPSRRLLILEANDMCGRKLLATGGGRCNISNLAAEDFCRTRDFFGSIGVPLRVEEGGRAYPVSGQAASALSALMCVIERGNVEFRYSARVVRVECSFEIFLEDGTTVSSERVLIAAGGKAGPQFGCRGESYSIARSFGHSVSGIRPALVPLVYADEDSERLSSLAGLRIKAGAELYIGGRREAASSGELQFTAYGLSGIMIFDLSLAVPASAVGRGRRPEGETGGSRRPVSVVLDFAPELDGGTLERIMRENETLRLEGVVGKKLSELLAREGDGDPVKVAKLAKRFPVPIGATKGWKEAQATFGGVPPAEINENTGESLLCKGLFFAGEALEPAFVCGGYNLNFAWLSGLRAGENL